MKKIFYWIGGLVAVLAAGIFVASRLMDATFISEKVSQVIQENTGTPLEFASVPSITFLPPGVEFGELRWDAVKDRSGVRFSAKGGKASVALAPLLHGNIVINEVTLNAPAVEVYLPESAADSAASTPSPETKNSPLFALPTSLPFELELLKVREGEVSCTQGVRQYSLKNLDVTLGNLRANAEADLSSSFSYTLSLAGQELTGTLDLSAKADLFAEKPSIRDISLKVTRNGALPSSLGPAQLTGDVNFDQKSQTLALNALSLTLPKAGADFTGAVNLKELSVQGVFRLEAELRTLAAFFGVTLPGQASYELALKGSMQASAKKLSLSGMEGKLDDTSITSDINIIMEEAPSVSGKLALGDLNLDPYLTQATEKKDTDQKNDTKHAAKESKALPALDLRLDMASLRWQGLKARSVQGILRGSQGKYTLETLAASLESGGTLVSSGHADLNRNDYAVVLTAKDFNIGSLLQALGKERSVEGTAHAQAELTAKGSNAEGLMSSLSGSGEVTAQDLKSKTLTEILHGIPVFKDITSSTFTRVRLPFTASSGVLKISSATAASEILKVTANATVDLPRQYAKGTATINALGVKAPITIEGPFTNISYALDPRFTMGVLKGVGGSILNGGKNAGSLTPDTARRTEKAVKDVGKALKDLFPR